MAPVVRMALVFLVSTLLPTLAPAEEIVAGVSITPVSLDAPINEQPYFGFAEKTAHQKKADADFIRTILSTPGVSREEGGARVAEAGGHFMARGDWSTAAKRFNQAWLLDPGRSDIAHGFAIIVHERFRNSAYALELFEAAHKLKAPRPHLAADHARLLLMTGKTKEAIPLLERAIQQTPDWEVPFSNLAAAYLDTGQPARACEMLAKVPANTNPNIRPDVERVRRTAKCP